MKEALNNIIRPGLRLVASNTTANAHNALTSRAAEEMLMAIGMQESLLKFRWQIIDPNDHSKKGPARGLWQFERGGGVRGVLTHRASAVIADRVCRAQGVNPRNQTEVWEALAEDDKLAAAFARLLLWTDPPALPNGNESQAWDLYLRTWRPGAAQRDYDNLRSKFLANYRKAREVR